MKYWYFLWKTEAANGWGTIVSTKIFFPLRAAQESIIHGSESGIAGAQSKVPSVQTCVAIGGVIEISEEDYNSFEFVHGKF
jgi:hypothetical protein